MSAIIRTPLVTVAGAVLVLAVASTVRAEGKPAVPRLRTPDGIEFGLLGGKPAAPAPTLFVFANDIDGTLGDASYYNKVGRLLAK